MKLSQLTIQSELVEVLVPEVLWVAAELGVPLPGGDLEVVVADPPGDPAHLAVAGEEAAAEAEAAQGAVLGRDSIDILVTSTSCFLSKAVLYRDTVLVDTGSRPFFGSVSASLRQILGIEGIRHFFQMVKIH